MADQQPTDARAAGAAAEPFVTGLSHRTAPAALRDRLMPDEAGGSELVLQRLAAAGIRQALVLATCDRVEIVGADAAPAAAAETALAVLAGAAGLAVSSLEPQAYAHSGEAALRHLFKVAAALDSVVVGEPEILGQVKAAHRLAVEAGCVGPELEAALQAAYAAARRVRAETTLAEQPVSLAAVAAKLARTMHGDLADAGALLIGAGEMGAAIVRTLRAQGLTRLAVATGSPGRGAALARELGARHLPIAELDGALEQGDVVLAACSAGAPVVTLAALRRALQRRRRRPMLLIDLGVPGDVAREAEALSDAFLYRLEDLERISAGGLASRERAATAAATILEEEIARHQRAGAARQAVPAVVALRRHFEQARAEVLARGAGLDAEAATRLLINRLLHEPTTALKALSAEPAHGPGERRRIERTLLKLFGIERRYGGPSARDESSEDEGTDAQS